MDLLGNGRLVVALEVVLDHVVGPHVDANLVGADRTLERRPTAVAGEVVVALGADAAVLARVLAAFAGAAHGNAVEAPRVLGGFGNLGPML